MAKTESLPAHLQEKDSKGDDHLTLYERHEKPTAYQSRPSLSSPRSTNDIVRAFSRANPTPLRSAINRVPTLLFTSLKFIFCYFIFYKYGRILTYKLFDLLVLKLSSIAIYKIVGML